MYFLVWRNGILGEWFVFDIFSLKLNFDIGELLKIIYIDVEYVMDLIFYI